MNDTIDGKNKFWEIDTNTPHIWQKILETCENAEKSIDLEQYIFINDEIGKKFLDLFEKKAKEGVKVRMLCDTAGSFPFYGSTLLKDLNDRGIEVRFFNTFIPVIFRSYYSWWFFRTHRRLVIVDNKIGFTGSFCIWEYTEKWKEIMIKVEGEAVKEMSDSFEIMWEGSRRENKGMNRFSFLKKRIHSGFDGFNFVSNVPRFGGRDLYYRMIETLRGAKKSIKISVPYFVPDRRLLRVLLLARRRGVKITILLPLKSDYHIVDLSARTYFKELLDVGIDIYLYDKGFLHHKIIITDDSWATVGSMNLDNVSLRYNFEGNIISNDHNFIIELARIMDKDISLAKKLERQDWLKRPLFDRFFEKLVRPIRVFI